MLLIGWAKLRRGARLGFGGEDWEPGLFFCLGVWAAL